MKRRITTYDLKAKASHRIYFVTDVHYEATRPQELTPILAEARQAHPSSIIIAGDFINYLDDLKSPVSRQQLTHFFTELSQIAPVFIGLGNHDQMYQNRAFDPAKVSQQQTYLDFLSSIPQITIVHNKKVKLSNKINLIGLTLPRSAYQLPGSKGTEEPKAELERFLRSQSKLLNGLKPGETNLLLIHSPRRFTPEIVSSLANIDYILTGHMHQGCIPLGLDEKLPGTRGLIAPGYVPLPLRARHTYPKYSPKLIVFPAYKTFAGWRRFLNFLFPQSHSILDLYK